MTEKESKEPQVLFFEGYGMVRVNKKDFVAEEDPRKVTMWSDRRWAQEAVDSLDPVDPMRKSLLPRVQIAALSEGIRLVREMNVLQRLRDDPNTFLTDSERALV